MEEQYRLLMECYEQPNTRGNKHNLRWLAHDLEQQLSRKRMSRITEAFLRRIPLSDIVRKRQGNWEILYQSLGRFCLWEITRPDFAPFAFPFLVPQDYPVEILHTLLTRAKVFCRRMWYPLPLIKNLYPLEEALSKRLLLLPCDQRYGKEDMQRIAELVIKILEDPNWVARKGGSFDITS